MGTNLKILGIISLLNHQLKHIINQNPQAHELEQIGESDGESGPGGRKGGGSKNLEVEGFEF